jgi:hypothetical protein
MSEPYDGGMGKKSAAQMLKRWIELDQDLAMPDGLNIKSFAKRWGEDERTIRRDIAMFTEFGANIVQWQGDEDLVHSHGTLQYAENAGCLFTKNALWRIPL